MKAEVMSSMAYDILRGFERRGREEEERRFHRKSIACTHSAIFFFRATRRVKRVLYVILCASS